MSTLVIGEAESDERQSTNVVKDADRDLLVGKRFVIAERPMVSLVLREADTRGEAGSELSNGPTSVMSQIVKRGVSALLWIDSILTHEALARAPRLDIAVGVPMSHLDQIDRYCSQLRKVDGLSEDVVDFIARVEDATLELSRSTGRLRQIVRNAKNDQGIDGADGAGVDPRVQKWILIASLRAERGAGKLLGALTAFQQVRSHGNVQNYAYESEAIASD